MIGDVFEANGRSQDLIVFVHGMGRGPEDFAGLRDLARDCLPDADHYCPKFSIGLFATHQARDVAHDLRDRLDSIASATDYRSITLVGHSTGALLLRAAWCSASGVAEDATVDAAKALPWIGRVRRIVLLAALGRGWNSTIAMSPQMRFVFWLATVWESLFLPRLTVFEQRRGAAFLTAVRLRSLRLDEAYKAAGVNAPSVVQILGTVDELVAPADNVDLVTGGSFYYREAPATGHLEVVSPNTPERREILTMALFADDITLSQQTMDIDEVTDRYSDLMDDFDPVVPPSQLTDAPEIQEAVMIVHGIRDYGYWTKRLAAKIKDKSKSLGRECRTVTSSYGFFPLAPFLLPAMRKRRVEWFMEQYLKARSLYPRARFSFVGHSNGTYLLATALQECPAIRFDRIIFAGSVVRRNFDWDAVHRRSQMSDVVNYVATNDWVVAIFPKFLARLKVFDLGGAGVDGFDTARNVINVEFVEGQHNAAIVEGNWDDLAGCVLGQDVSVPAALGRQTRNEPLNFVYSWMVVGLLMLVAGLTWCVHWVIVKWTPGAGAEILLTAAIMAFIGRIVLTKL